MGVRGGKRFEIEVGAAYAIWPIAALWAPIA
jgi:hypothetical protein